MSYGKKGIDSAVSAKTGKERISCVACRFPGFSVAFRKNRNGKKRYFPDPGLTVLAGKGKIGKNRSCGAAGMRHSCFIVLDNDHFAVRPLLIERIQKRQRARNLPAGSAGSSKAENRPEAPGEYPALLVLFCFFEGPAGCCAQKTSAAAFESRGNRRRFVKTTV